MKTRIKWVEGVSFVGEAGSGHAVVIDGAPESGGRNLGMRPMEMVLTGAAACTAFDVVFILKQGSPARRRRRGHAEAERAPGRAEGLHQDPPTSTRSPAAGSTRGRSSARSSCRRRSTARRRSCSPRPRHHLRDRAEIDGEQPFPELELYCGSLSSRIRLDVSQRPPPRACTCA